MYLAIVLYCSNVPTFFSMYGFFISNEHTGKCNAIFACTFFGSALSLYNLQNIRYIPYNPHKHWVLLFEYFFLTRNIRYKSEQQQCDNTSITYQTANVRKTRNYRTLQRNFRTIAKPQQAHVAHTNPSTYVESKEDKFHERVAN